MSKRALKAIIFDVDGTMADTEHAHMAAFNQAFAEEGLDWHWDEATYTKLLEISGGKERILHYWRQQFPDVQSLNGTDLKDRIDRLHLLKTAAYEAAVQRGEVQLRPGVLDLIHEAQVAGVQLAIATTTSPVNIAALLRMAMGEAWRLNFTAVQDASTAPNKKPHPQVYEQMLRDLQLEAQDCLAIEDSANGLRSASAAGIATVVTTNSFTVHHDFTGALAVLPSLAGVHLADLQGLYAKAQA
jgi:HAD superfamily hydrolase (TIGR01509 family)